DAAEAARIADRLEEHHEDFGAALVQQVLDDVEALQAGLVARADHVAEREALRPAAIEEREAYASALRDHGESSLRIRGRKDLSRFFKHGAGGGAQAGRR